MSKYRFVSQLALEAHLSPFHELLTNRNSGTYPDCKKKCGLPTFQKSTFLQFESFVVRWMDLESVIQSEVSQKEKNKYRMLTHIYGI